MSSEGSDGETRETWEDTTWREAAAGDGTGRPRVSASSWRKSPVPRGRADAGDKSWKRLTWAAG